MGMGRAGMGWGGTQECNWFSGPTSDFWQGNLWEALEGEVNHNVHLGKEKWRVWVVNVLLARKR